MDKRADVDARAEWRVQAFCRRQNLGVGAIHLPRAFEISQDSIKITTPNGVVIFMSCVDKKDAQQKCRTKVRHFCVFTKNAG